MTEADWPTVRSIYEAGIATGHATFEASAPDWEVWDRTHLAAHRFVAVDDAGLVSGWVALSAVSDRCALSGVAELSVYVAPAARGCGVGRRLLDALTDAADASGIWTLQAGVFPENVASVALHHAAGFRTVGRRERLGRLNGRWRDVLLLERRSATIG